MEKKELIKKAKGFIELVNKGIDVKLSDYDFLVSQKRIVELSKDWDIPTNIDFSIYPYWIFSDDSIIGVKHDNDKRFLEFLELLENYENAKKAFDIIDQKIFDVKNAIMQGQKFDYDTCTIEQENSISVAIEPFLQEWLGASNKLCNAKNSLLLMGL